LREAGSRSGEAKLDHQEIPDGGRAQWDVEQEGEGHHLGFAVVAVAVFGFS
jgi:hypothetical protein